MKRTIRFLAVAFSVALISVAVLMIWWISGERDRIHDAAVASAHLAQVPDLEYEAATHGGLFSRTYYISFTCSEEEFQKFVFDSPGLKDVTPYIFPYSEAHPQPTTWDKPPEYMRSSMREARFFWDTNLYDSNTNPRFWNSSVKRKRGKRYEIVIPKEAIHGFLLRDDETGSVFLRVSYS